MQLLTVLWKKFEILIKSELLGTFEIKLSDSRYFGICPQNLPSHKVLRQQLLRAQFFSELHNVYTKLYLMALTMLLWNNFTKNIPEGGGGYFPVNTTYQEKPYVRTTCTKC